MVNIPEEVKDACRRHWAQHQRVRVVCDGKRGTFMLQNGCIPVVLVDGKDGELVSPNLFEKLSGGQRCLAGFSGRLPGWLLLLPAGGACMLAAVPAVWQAAVSSITACPSILALSSSSLCPRSPHACYALHTVRFVLCAACRALTAPLAIGPAGKEACKNWQQSIKVEGFTMTGDPSGPGMKMGHFVRIVGIQTSNSATEYGM